MSPSPARLSPAAPRTRRGRSRFATVASLGAALLLALGGPERPVAAQQDLQSLIDALPTRRRVGQLFLVPFDDANPVASTLETWIGQGLVGGVVLSPERGNFRNEDGAMAGVTALVDQLQAAAGRADPPLPAWVVMSADGPHRPGPSLWHGMAPRTSAMALGATWKPEHARRVGRVAGREMARAGVSMLLGPSLDVLARPAARELR